MRESNDHTTAVLIVGGGITGLSAALFLARRGVRPILVERHPSTAIMPQARAVNPRSMEIYRAAGLEAEIRARRSILTGLPEMIGAQTLTGAERFRTDLLAHVRPGDVSPTDWALVDQDELERVVRAHAERAGADVRFGTELVGLDAGERTVTATVRDRSGGTESRVRADYLVAADGNRSGVRRTLGVGADGPGVFGHAAHFLFDADLDDALRDRRFLLAYLDRPAAGTVLVPLRERGRWMLGVPYRPDDGAGLAEFTEERCAEAVRQATGIPGLALTLVPPVTGWSTAPMDVTIGAWVAERFREGRVFLAGDAAHVVPPTGSFGASTGIADAHNLAWKLAAVLRGDAGPAVLDTYDAERRPVARATMDTATRILTARHGAAGDGAAGGGATEIDEVAMALGYRYRSTAVRTEPDTPDGPVEDPRTPSGRPGLRAPHVRLDDAGRSTLDLLTPGCTLLTGADGAHWGAAAAPLGLAVRSVDGPPDRLGRFLDAYGITATGATLVRPDGFVAWRAPTRPAHPEGELRRALAGVLAREG